ncbi:beta-glucosidase 18-like isoform X1 [Bidens hawaiensis]|uniref:beta-glucosidase 18-like isoform X1 n=2 Tax=Bidens hawaiensis TaxID=980011 RepID=UPI00404B8FD3
MGLNSVAVYLLFVIFACSWIVEASINGQESRFNQDDPIKRSDFPPGFLFGAAISAYQIEGAYLEDGKSLSNWDEFCHSKGCSEDGENGDVADDHYHLFMQDIELMHSLGLKAYRFSISWTRILPRGRFGEVNPLGIMFYNKIINNLILKGIEPFVTIYHNDFPQELKEKYGSWLDPQMQDDFIHFTETCFKSFGDRVKYWITINEPNLLAEMSYERGIYPPNHCSQPFGNCLAGNSDVEPLYVMHNMLLAHGKAAKLYHDNFQPTQGGLIGIVSNCFMFEPLTDSYLDKKAAGRAMLFYVGWAVDPPIFGDYPQEMREYHGNELPTFSQEEKEFMKNSIDFIGINHYSALYAKDCANSSCTGTANRAIKGFVEITGEHNGVPIGDRTSIDRLFVVPRGMEEIVNYMKTRYNNTPMFITENGYSSPNVQDVQVEDIVNAFKRIEFHQKYLASLADAIRNGADVRGYFVWSLMDNYEWSLGYNFRFGLHHVDRKTFDRIPKLSAKWYQEFLKNNSLVDHSVIRSHKSLLISYRNSNLVVNVTQV